MLKKPARKEIPTPTAVMNSGNAHLRLCSIAPLRRKAPSATAQSMTGAL